MMHTSMCTDLYHDTETHTESCTEVSLPYISVTDNQQVYQNITTVENSQYNFSHNLM